MTNPILAHTRVELEGSTPTRFMLVLHGVFGMGSNLRTLAKHVAAKVPSWGFVLVDLRGHGASQGFAPPQTVAAAAGDVADLVASLDVEVRGVTGHSFGGKVALSLLERRVFDAANVFVLDSMPGPRHGTDAVEDVVRILGFLEQVPQPLASREAFTDLCRDAGLSKPTSDWLAMNVRRADDGYRLRLDLPGIRAMMTDFGALDLWPTLEDPTLARRIDLIVGGASRQFSNEDLARARLIESTHPRVHVSVLERAGHWVHTDDPVGLAELMANALEL